MLVEVTAIVATFRTSLFLQFLDPNSQIHILLPLVAGGQAFSPRESFARRAARGHHLACDAGKLLLLFDGNALDQKPW